MKTKFYITILALAMGLLAATGYTQLNPFDTGNAEQPILDASPSGGISPTMPLERARAAAGVAEGQPLMTAPIDREMRDEGHTAFEPGPGMSPYIGGPTMPVPTPTPFIKMIRVITGRRVNCAVCGKLLEDVQYDEVPETMKDLFYDDGTHGDEVANDGTYTNIEEIKDFIGPECLPLVIRLVNLLVASEDFGPLGFFRLFALTDEPVSLIPKRISTEEDLDAKLESWAGLFLRMFRQNKDDIYSAFYNLYVPPPPTKPKLPIPPGFNPVAMEKMRQQGSGQMWQGGPMPGGVMPEAAGVGPAGEPVGPATGKYYNL